MRFQLIIDTDNAAFDDADELPNLIHKVAHQLSTDLDAQRFGCHTQSVLDSNGNRVGGFKISEDD